MSKVTDGKVEVEKLNYGKLFRSSWFYIVCLAIITTAVFHQFFTSNEMLFSSDQMSGFDSRVFLKSSLNESHQFPLWFNSRLSGMPTVDAMFGDPFYPFSVIINSLMPIGRAVSFKMIFHVFLAGMFFFLLLRKGFKISPFLSFVGSLFYMLSPQFFSHIYPGHDGKMFVIAWLPFIIWRLKVLMETPNLLNSTLLSLGIGMSLLTTHVQMNYFVMWGLFFYWAMSAVICFVSEHNVKKSLSITGYFWLAIIIGLALSLVSLLPPFVFVHDAFSVRGVDRGFEFASSWSLHWPEALSLWIPEFVNSLDYYWGDNPFKLNSEYIGAFSLVLAILSVISTPKKWRFFWAGTAVFALLFALGAHTPIFHLAYYLVPGVKKFRAPSMIMFWFSFSSVLLAILFLKDMMEGKLSSLSEIVRKKWIKGLFISNGVLLLLTLLFSNRDFVYGLFSTTLIANGKTNIFDANFSTNFLPFLWLWMILTTALIFLLVGVINNKVKPVLVVVFVLLVGLFDVLRVDSEFIKLTNPKPYFYTDPIITQLETQIKTEPFRCFSIPGALPQNGEGIHGLEGVNGFNDNELRWYRDFRGDQNDRNFLFSLVGFNENGQPYLNGEKLSEGNPFLDLANVKYILVRPQNDLLAIENKNALGRVSFVSKYVVIDSTKIADALLKGEYDYRNTIALSKEPSVKPASNSEMITGEFSAKWQKYTPNYRKVEVLAPSKGFLRISEVYYPGWEIRIDGKKTDVLQADLAWMAVPIDSGKHEIEMMPHSIILGKIAWVSVFTAIALCGYWISYVLIRRRKVR